MGKSKFKEVDIAKFIILFGLFLSLNSIFFPSEKAKNKTFVRQKTVQSPPNNTYRSRSKTSKSSKKPFRSTNSKNQIFDYDLDKGYLDITIEKIMQDKTFNSKYPDIIPNLQRSYILYINSTETINWRKVNNRFYSYYYNNISYSDNSIKFYNIVLETKKIYYDYFISTRDFSKTKIESISGNRNFKTKINFDRIEIFIEEFFKIKKIKWSLIDQKINEVMNSDKNKEFTFVIRKLKAFYLTFKNQENKKKITNNESYDFFSMMNDQTYRKYIDFDRMQRYKKYILYKGEGTWNDLTSQVKSFINGKIEYQQYKISNVKYNILNELSYILKQYSNFKENKKVPKGVFGKSPLCNKKCIHNCERNYNKIKDFLECGRKSCLCRDKDIININPAKIEGSFFKLFSPFFTVLIIIFAIMLLGYYSIKAKRSKIRYEVVPQDYELMNNQGEMKENLINDDI